MYGTYLILVFVLILFAVGGVEATMRFFAYVDIELRWHWVIFRAYLLRRKLEKELGIKPTSFSEHYKTYGKR
jgi:hypothetical protein